VTDRVSEAIETFTVHRLMDPDEDFDEARRRLPAVFEDSRAKSTR
jgi:hypothetical protein